jgi:uncharacterized membrane protein YhaH (DUF805 family)
MRWYMEVLRKYANFSGRARRREYWTFALVNSLIFTAFYAIYYIMLARGGSSWTLIAFIFGIYGLIIIIPSWAVVVRRLHDTGRSGWWVFVSIIPLIGELILLFILLADSQQGNNQYGPNPKYFGMEPGAYPPQYAPPYPAQYPPSYPAQYPPPQGAFCPRCGGQNPAAAGFCQNCGTRLR